jgi:hypothetical protein
MTERSSGPRTGRTPDAPQCADRVRARRRGSTNRIRDQRRWGMRRGRPAVTNNGDVDLPVNELIPTCLCLAEMQYVDGFREFPGAPGAAARQAQSILRCSRSVTLLRCRTSAGCRRLDGGHPGLPAPMPGWVEVRQARLPIPGASLQGRR